MGFGFISWALGYVLNKGFDAILNISIINRLDSVVIKWAERLPENAYVFSGAVYNNEFFPKISSESNEAERPCLHTVRAKLKSDILPSYDEWYDAFYENWLEIKKSDVELQPFFKLTDPSQYLRELSENVFNEILNDEKIFKHTLINILNSKPKFYEFSSVSELILFTEEIDEKTREIVRQLSNDDQSKSNKNYETVLTGALAQKNISLNSLLEDFRREQKNKMSSEEIMKSINVHVDVKPKFDTIQFQSEEIELPIIVEFPKLLWDCHCETPNGVIPRKFINQKFRDQLCQIHSNKHGTDLHQRFVRDLNLITYNDIKVVWKQSAEFWPPSIDSFVLVKNLEDEGIVKNNCETLLDLGSGTGFLGIYMYQKNQSIKEVYFSDWLLTPLFFSIINWELNSSKNRIGKAIPLLGLGTTWFLNKHIPDRFDICVCNPPYLPDLNRFSQIKIDHTVGGTDLLIHLLKRREIAKDVYVNISNMAKDEANRCARKMNIKMERIGNSISVPFRVATAFKCTGYVQELVKRKKLIVNDNSEYRYWHRLATYKLTKK